MRSVTDCYLPLGVFASALSCCTYSVARYCIILDWYYGFLISGCALLLWLYIDPFAHLILPIGFNLLWYSYECCLLSYCAIVRDSLYLYLSTHLSTHYIYITITIIHFIIASIILSIISIIIIIITDPDPDPTLS